VAREFQVARRDELDEQRAHVVELEGQRIALFLVAGELFAIDDVCMHLGGSLARGERDGMIVSCPWHGWEFDLSNGAMCQLPKLRQRCFAVREEDGHVFVALPDQDNIESE